MQQTTNYQLNLIETSDAFSPNPLNDNAQKLEAALDAARAEAKAGDAAEASARASADAAEATARANADKSEANTRASAITALSKRVTTLEGRKVVTGYAATAGTVKLGFTPSGVLMYNPRGNIMYAALDHPNNVFIVSGGFKHDGQFAECLYLAVL